MFECSDTQTQNVQQLNRTRLHWQSFAVFYSVFQCSYYPWPVFTALTEGLISAKESRAKWFVADRNKNRKSVCIWMETVKPDWNYCHVSEHLMWNTAKQGLPGFFFFPTTTFNQSQGEFGCCRSAEDQTLWEKPPLSSVYLWMGGLCASVCVRYEYMNWRGKEEEWMEFDAKVWSGKVQPSTPQAETSLLSTQRVQSESRKTLDPQQQRQRDKPAARLRVWAASC